MTHISYAVDRLSFSRDGKRVFFTASCLTEHDARLLHRALKDLRKMLKDAKSDGDG